VIPIKLALLWHQHQPDYRSGPRMVLPWVRMHATKDYLEMAQHLERHPKMRATINLVPILIKQIEGYQDGMEDDLLHIAKKETGALSEKEKKYLLAECFHSNVNRMIARSERYNELFEKKQRGNEFGEDDLRDLIIHFGLAWTGEFCREEEPYASLIKKGRYFTEEEKILFLNEQEIIIDRILPLHSELFENGQIEISATPYYHPILPLLCDTDAAREAMPDVTLPQNKFSRLNDGYEHVRRAMEIYEERFGLKLQGMWPAEGSISDTALQILMEENIQWTASDETVLLNSLQHSSSDDRRYNELEKCFPRKYIGHAREIVLFFRDHGLSDKIGFEYASWDARDAANDFVNECKRIRDSILQQFGEEALKQACISVILDGENCWENYYENGKYFLNEFYTALTSTPEIQTVTFSQAIEEIGKENIRPLSHVVAGSWVGGNFKIWIGDPEKNRAWDLLADAAEALHGFAASDAESREHYDDAHTSLLKAEGSDWMWWYGDDNASAQKQIFDQLFRAHLIEVYVHLRLPVPKELLEPIGGGNWTSSGGAMHRAE
jgi:alpha-amylase/alpha-mannosidase (GH57 family)